MSKTISLQNKMTHEQFQEALEQVPDEVLSRISFSMPWQYSDTDTSGYAQDADGFPLGQNKQDDPSSDRDALQQACFKKFHSNPHVNTSVRGMVGRLTGLGFGVSCGEVYQIQEAIEEIDLDPRNRLYNYWPKYIGRYNIEGELFLCLSVHPDGFIEVDFIDPGVVSEGGDGSTGIIYHPNKPTMPLFYNIRKSGEGNKKPLSGSIEDRLVDQIPSIFVARYPDLVDKVKDHKDFFPKLQKKSKKSGSKYKKMGGFYRFIVSWDRGFMTRRAVSYLRTVLEWLNHYETLKKYEIDHKKSSGSYVWVFSFEDVKAFRTWLSLTDEEKRKTAVGAKLTPGGRLILPPGMSVEAKNPSLPQIKDQDTDIMQLVASGLNEPEDILTGTSRNSFSSVKASRGPFSDRVSDEIAYFDRFLRHDFWGSVFFLKSAISDFPSTFKVRRAVSFKSKKPEFKLVPKRPELLIEISYPTSDVIDFEARARGLLGVKHGPMSEQLGVSNKWVAERMGVGNYSKARLDKATEEDRYPELVYEAGVDAESVQERVEGEKPKSKNQQMDELREALSNVPATLLDSVKEILRDSEDKFLRGTRVQNEFMANVFKNLNELKDNFPININVEPPVINIPSNDPSITVVAQPAEKPKTFNVVRDENGFITEVRERETDGKQSMLGSNPESDQE